MAKQPTSRSASSTEKDDARKPPDKRAVALSYDPSTAEDAPIVSASGEGYLAERIIETAIAAGVPVQSDSDLLQLLAATEIGDEIPVEAFVAVAEILRYVYDLNGRSAPRPEGS